MSTTKKSQAIAHELADRLRARPNVAALGIVETYDATDHHPLILIGAIDLTASPVGATTVACAVLKVEPADWPLAQDVFGNAALSFAPHSIHILKEAGPAGNPTGGGLSASAELELLLQSAAMGTEVRLYETTSGSGVVYANIDDETKLKAAYAPDAYRPLISQQ